MCKRASVIARIMQHIKMLLKDDSEENKVFLMAFLSANYHENEASLVPCFFMKSNTCFRTFHLAHVKYVNFLHRLI